MRKYKWRYVLMVVNNHYFDRYSFFLQAWRFGDALHYSYDLMEMPRDEAKYQQVMQDLRAHTKMRIEYRDTHDLVHPGRDIVNDMVHGHGTSTRYHDQKMK